MNRGARQERRQGHRVSAEVDAVKAEASKSQRTKDRGAAWHVKDLEPKFGAIFIIDYDAHLTS
jgi:hypothetical protein